MKVSKALKMTATAHRIEVREFYRGHQVVNTYVVSRDLAGYYVVPFRGTFATGNLARTHRRIPRHAW